MFEVQFFNWIVLFFLLVLEPYQNEEDGKLCGLQVPLAKGEMLIRDCRMAHSGMPNETSNDRVLPGIQINTAEWLASDGNI